MLCSNFARSTSFVKVEVGDQTLKHCTVFLPCPRSFAGTCPYLISVWSCDTCKYALKYGNDEYCYCNCGRALANTFTFKCNSPRHGDSFEQFSEKDLIYLLARMKVLKEVNILVLGETGVGKSTWINAIANYMTFSTFEAAEISKPVYLIPSVESIRYKRGKIKFIIGEESDAQRLEQYEAGHSVTQYPASYVFKYNDCAVRLIDTPGIGDTRGIDVDKTNFQSILDHLSHFDRLHGICILLPPNQTRLTPSFRFCTKELLRQLHRDACKNIMFCFTRSRDTDYTPGSTVGILNAMLADMADVKIPLPLTADTLYSTDSEAIAYLFAANRGNVFDATFRECRKQSWETSVAETGRLLKNILKLDPHKMHDTTLLNECRRVILALCMGPLASISSSIQVNIQQLEAMEAQLSSAGMTEEELRKKLNVSPVLYKMIPLKRPRVVCSSEACSRFMHIVIQDNVEKLQYDQVCCDECRAPILRMCESFRLMSKCKVCSCSISYHTLMTHDVIHAKAIPAESPSTQNKVSSVLETEKREHRYMVEVLAKLMLFLDRNSVIAQSDVFVENIKKRIELESRLVAQQKKGWTKDVVGNLKRLLQEYQTVRAGLSDDGKLDGEGALKLKDSLFALERNGQKLKAAVEVVQTATDELVKHGDIVFIPQLESVNQALMNPIQRVMAKDLPHTAST